MNPSISHGYITIFFFFNINTLQNKTSGGYVCIGGTYI